MKKPTNLDTVDIGINFMGHDMIARVEYSVASYGCPASWDGPAEGPEFDVYSIKLLEDLPGYLGPAFEADGALFWVLSDNQRIRERIEEDAAENYEPPRRSYRGRSSFAARIF